MLMMFVFCVIESESKAAIAMEKSVVEWNGKE